MSNHVTPLQMTVVDQQGHSVIIGSTRAPCMISVHVTRFMLKFLSLVPKMSVPRSQVDKESKGQDYTARLLEKALAMGNGSKEPDMTRDPSQLRPSRLSQLPTNNDSDIGPRCTFS